MSTVSVLQSELERIVAEAVDGTPDERAAVLGKCANALNTLGKWTGQNLDVSQAKIVKTPAWRRIETHIVQALDRDWIDGMTKAQAMLWFATVLREIDE